MTMNKKKEKRRKGRKRTDKRKGGKKQKRKMTGKKRDKLGKQDFLRKSYEMN